MKITKNMYYCESYEAEDLYLYIINNRDLYFEIVTACKTFAKHLKNYSKDKAIAYYYRIASKGAKMYKQELGNNFSVTNRYTVAVDLEENFFDRVKEEATK